MKYIDYLPEILKGIKEFNALDTALGAQVDNISRKADQTLNEPIVATATEKGIERFESLLNLNKAGKTLEQRRQAVATKLMCAPFTENWLLQKLKAKYGPRGADVYLEREKYHVCIELLEQDETALHETYDDFVSVIPANMVLSVKEGKKEYADLNFTAIVMVADVIEYEG